MPVPAAGGANAARVKCSSNPAQVRGAGRTNGIYDGQCIRGKLGGILGLSFPAKCGGIRSIVRIAEPATLRLASADLVRSEMRRRSFSPNAA